MKLHSSIYWAPQFYICSPIIPVYIILYWFMEIILANNGLPTLKAGGLQSNVLSKGVPFKALAAQYAANCNVGKIYWNATAINTTIVTSEQIRQWVELLGQTLHFGGCWENEVWLIGDTTGNKDCEPITRQVSWFSFLNMRSELNQATTNN